jgi:hypothetical protein
MKKILLTPALSLLIAIFSILNGQTIPQTTSTPDGIQNPVITCSFGVGGGPSSCADVCRNSGVFTNNNDGTFTFRFVFIKNSSGAKSIEVVIECGATQVINSCIDLSAISSGVQYNKSYTFPCTSLALLKVSLTPHTNGSCGGTICGAVLISIGGGPLPVSFKSFAATRNHSNVVVKWETAAEINNNGFAVERNTNGLWEQVAFVTSQAINGNSDVSLNYQYIDVNSSKGISQYRIKQVDFDNNSKYSEIRTVRGEAQIGKIIVYPNPTFDGRVKVSFEDASVLYDATLMDMNGRAIKKWKDIRDNITIENLNPGMYTLMVVVPETGEQIVQKIVVNKR